MKKYLVIIATIFFGFAMNAQESKTRLSLQEAIDFAIENSYNTRVAKKGIESAKQQKWETTTIGLPQIEGQVDYVNNLKKELILFVKKEIGPIAAPDVIHWAPGLPKTRSGNIMRRILRKISADEADQLGDVTTLADPSVVEELKETFKKMQEGR